MRLTQRLALPQNPIAEAARIARGIAVAQADLSPAALDALIRRALGDAAPALAGAAWPTSR
jgi:enhancing lycopene biosynthesis protein 2